MYFAYWLVIINSESSTVLNYFDIKHRHNDLYLDGVNYYDWQNCNNLRFNIGV